jgi:hypothetical protein
MFRRVRRITKVLGIYVGGDLDELGGCGVLNPSKLGEWDFTKCVEGEKRVRGEEGGKTRYRRRSIVVYQTRICASKPRSKA